MKIANVQDRACLLEGADYVDIHNASGGQFGPAPEAIFDRWNEFAMWATPREISAIAGGVNFDQLGAPSPRAQQGIGIGLNYKDHALEAGFDLPKQPVVFPKFTSCIAGPRDELLISSDTVDWEVELVVVIGQRCRNVSVANAWDQVAGLTVGQDISDRVLQFADPKPPQFGLGKSLRGFGPTGPYMVSIDEFDNPDDLAISCSLNNEIVQQSRTSQMIFTVPEIVSYLSSRLELLPGDLIFTGTPSGVGMSMNPQRYLKPGDILVSAIEGIGELTTRIGSAVV